MLKNRKQQFASDNYSGVCPEALDGFLKANEGFAMAYGNDEYTHLVSDKIRELFEIDCEVFFVFNGTAANSLALSSLCQSYHSIICADVAHIETDECGAPEFFSNGTKLLTVPSDDGKLNVVVAEEVITKRSDLHFPKPKVLSITQPTEAGTIYSIDELKQIQKLKDKYGLKLHMDGSRFANAIASLNCKPSEITWKVGVDVLCFGGTKIGMPFGEIVAFFNRVMAEDFEYRCKQAGQLASKMRFAAAPWVYMLESGAWLSHAKKANSMAQEFAKKVAEIKCVNIAHSVDANAVFLTMPQELADKVAAKGWVFYNFIGGAHRFMFSWNSQQEDMEELAEDICQLAIGN